MLVVDPVRCPRCQATVTFQLGQPKICPQCGYGGQVPPQLRPTPMNYAPFASHQGYYGQGLHSQPLKTSGKAVAALILGIASWIIWFASIITAPLAIILGAMARGEIRSRPHELKGGGMAAWGIGLGIAGIVIVGSAVMLALVSDLGASGPGVNSGTNKVGVATCQDEHIRVALRTVETTIEAFSNDPITRISMEWVSRDSFGEISPSPWFEDALVIRAQGGQFTASETGFGSDLGPQDTEVFSYSLEGHSPAQRDWLSFTVSYTVSNGHDTGEREGTFSLHCDLAGDNAPAAFLV